MYEILLSIHNLLRWFFLAAAVYAIFKAVQGMMGGTPFGKGDKTAGTLLIASAHSQLLIGLILWFISPMVQHALTDVAAAMKDKMLRLTLLEHPLTMIIAIAIIQIGKIRASKAYADADKHKRCLIFYGIGLLLVLSKIPWGSSPMFRF
jgi:hypothetical protein